MKQNNLIGFILYSVTILTLFLTLFVGCQANDEESESFKKYGQEFKGKIAESYDESEPWWPPVPNNLPKRPPAA